MNIFKANMGFMCLAGIVFVSTIAGLLFGFDLVVISGALQFIAKTFNISSAQIFLRETIVSAVPTGALLGAICSGKLAYMLGRRKSIIITAVLFFIGTSLVVVSQNITSVICGRLIIGIAVGLSATIVPMYLAELSAPKIRGTIVFLYQFAITVGIALGFVVNYVFQSSENWRAMFSIGLAPAILLGLGMLLLPDSPRWLMMKGEKASATRVLQILRGKENVSEELQEIMETAMRKQGGIKLLFSKTMRPLVFISFGLFMFQQLTGINTLFYYAPNIFKVAGFANGSTTALSSILTGGIFVFATIFGVILVDIIGRRKLLLIGLLGISLSQFLQGAVLSQLLVVNTKVFSLCAALLAITFYAVSITGIAYLMMAEIFPLNLRSIGMSVASCANWGVNILIAATFLTLAEKIGIGYTFWLYSFLTLIGFVFVWFFVPETKGRKLEEIEANLYTNVPMRYLGNQLK